MKVVFPLVVFLDRHGKAVYYLTPACKCVFALMFCVYIFAYYHFSFLILLIVFLAVVTIPCLMV